MYLFLVPTGRHALAMDVSPWLPCPVKTRVPKGRYKLNGPECFLPGSSCRRSATLAFGRSCSMDLRPWLTHVVPPGLKQNAQTLAVSQMEMLCQIGILA